MKQSPRTGTEPGSKRRPGVLFGAAVVVVPALYVFFVAHYGVNSLFNDDWSMVPIVHSVLHGHWSLSQLWAQHNEHRVLIPNLAFIVFGKVASLDARTIMLTSAVLFVASYWLMLGLWGRYAGRLPTPIEALVSGGVWFSLADFESALLAYQITWYMVIFLLFVLLFVLSKKTLGVGWIVGAGIVAVLASYSSLQGLFLWPVGALCLWRRRAAIEPPAGIVGAGWVGAAAVTTFIYFWNFDFSDAGSGSFRYALEHPFTAAKFLLAEIGNVVPSLTVSSLHWHMALGLVIVIAAIGVVVLSIREVRRDGFGSATPLPAALILFAFLFDLSSSAGRVSLGQAEALAPRYTMGNLLLVVAIALFILSRVRESALFKVSLATAVGVLVLVLLAGQIAESTDFGLRQAVITQRSRQVGATTLEHLSSLPKAEAKGLVSQNVYFSLAALEPLLKLAKEDHLGVFAR
jgi:hypothetical protein